VTAGIAPFRTSPARTATSRWTLVPSARAWSPGDVGVYGRERLFGGEARVAAQRRKSHGVVFHEISSPPWRVQNYDNWIAPTSRSGGAPSSSSRCAHWATSVARPMRSSGKPAGEFGHRHLEPVLQRGGDRLRGAARREASASRGAPILVPPLGRRRDPPLDRVAAHGMSLYL
jgi:hypothetical protein